MISQKLLQLLTKERLPADYADTVRDVLQPLASVLAARSDGLPGLLVGINGAQGSGKTTMTRVLALLLREVHGKNVVMLSLDDFYLTRAERRSLASQVHPLLATRGVPGTHDVALMNRTLDALAGAGPVPLPVFDKSMDDRAPAEAWPVHHGPADIILFEGWCVGLDAQAQEELERPVNNLEAREDRDGRWRLYVNQQLDQYYRPISGRLNLLIMLRVPSFLCVLEWRWLQEQKMARPMMDREAVQRFIQHFERLTRHALKSLPARADLVLSLDADHRISDVQPDIATLMPPSPGAQR